MLRVSTAVATDANRAAAVAKEACAFMSAVLNGRWPRREKAKVRSGWCGEKRDEAHTGLGSNIAMLKRRRRRGLNEW